VNTSAGRFAFDAVGAAGSSSVPKRRAAEPRPPPPIAALLNFALDELSDVFAVEPAEYHYNPIGVVHGSGRSRGVSFDKIGNHTDVRSL
jgi:hypothetical protein